MVNAADWDTFNAAEHTALPTFLMQIILVIFFAKILAKAFSYFRQPAVIGELIGGILLGPSALGKIPAFYEHVFPDFANQSKIAASTLTFKFQPYLYIAAQLGLIFFMFFLGLEIQPSMLYGYWKSAIPMAVSSVILPFFLGIGLSYWFYDLTGSTSHQTSFALMLGTCMSFTALPVLGRILGAAKGGRALTSEVGVMAIAIAAVDDILAWAALALVLVYVNGSSTLAGFYGVMLLIFFLVFEVVFLRLGLRSLYRKLLDLKKDEDPLWVMGVFVGLLFSAWVAEVIGVHALFGSFVFGLIVPKDGHFVEIIAPKIELLVVYIFVPLYFAYSGLSTNLSSIGTPALVFAMLFQTFLASFGKVVPITGMAYFLYKRDGIFSCALGSLINARGLVSLIAANIGLQAKVLNQTSFSMLVLMNVLTTVATPPFFYTLYEKYGLDRQYSKTAGDEGVETEMTSVKTSPGDQKSDDLQKEEVPQPLRHSLTKERLPAERLPAIADDSIVEPLDSDRLTNQGTTSTGGQNAAVVSFSPFKTAASLNQEW